MDYFSKYTIIFISGDNISKTAFKLDSNFEKSKMVLLPHSPTRLGLQMFCLKLHKPRIYSVIHSTVLLDNYFNFPENYCRNQRSNKIFTHKSISMQRAVHSSTYCRRLVGSTNQACSSGSYFRIAWKSTEWPCFFQSHSLSFLQSLRSLKNWLLQNLSMKVLDQKF